MKVFKDELFLLFNVLSRNIFIPLLFWKVIVASIEIWVNRYYPFSTLKMLFHCLLIFIDFEKKSVNILIFLPLCNISYTTEFCKKFSFYLFEQFGYYFSFLLLLQWITTDLVLYFYCLIVLYVRNPVQISLDSTRCH